jgi:hypothetical protein
MSGEILLNGSADALVPEAARRALHNLPKSGLKSGIVIDLVEYPEMGHVGVRCYSNQVAQVTVEERVKLFERMGVMVNVLKSFGVSASLEKVPGGPPLYER